ncbi:peptidyl-prolyl cis-trans isomerase B (cyclophilin B) [Paenimyroides ummariense]|uniref:peptidylprolyl isomerase n=1 Tax=Paenimyroides ummariense TaxID=913024 RepID=A0A1I5G135_9FLAO|nr:peptidylprolyl isomerase [Paenimyroides ummariense]SFO29569.1 peptidyl-prolyl cis-trans isomerase B (cyclophilin B) [Paenimyroides ummariense]
MKSYLYLFILIFVPMQFWAQSNKLQFKTTHGSFKVMLYDFTPKHKELILDAIRNDVYKNALFNRVIENFVVQGGEHDDDIALREKDLPTNEHYRLPAEFDSRVFHKMGALGAGRDDNPQKASFLNQIYFVVGKSVSVDDLDTIEQKKGIKFTKEQRETYFSKGGLPRLDGDYTVFGEVSEGFDVLLKISKLKTNEKDAPLQPVSFEIIEINE